MGVVDRLGWSEVQNLRSGVRKFENFAGKVGEISARKNFGAKFEFSKEYRSKNRYFCQKNFNITNNSLKIDDFHTF